MVKVAWPNNIKNNAFLSLSVYFSVDVVGQMVKIEPITEVLLSNQSLLLVSHALPFSSPNVISARKPEHLMVQFLITYTQLQKSACI